MSAAFFRNVAPIILNARYDAAMPQRKIDPSERCGTCGLTGTLPYRCDICASYGNQVRFDSGPCLGEHRATHTEEEKKRVPQRVG